MSLWKPRRIGNVYAFFEGKVVVGPDWKVMVVTVCFITIGSLLFVCYTNTINSARAVVGVFSVLSLVLLLICSLRDPGICPKELPPPIDAPPHDPLEVEMPYTNFDGSTGTASLERKWCYSCNLYRPVRAVHCRFCDVCVCRRDHHCPWSGCCIGAHNYLSYFGMVWSALVLTLTASIGAIMSLANRVDAINARQDAANITEDLRVNAFGAAITETYCIEILLLIVSVLWIMLVGTLATYHLYLALNNKTSSDDAKRGGDSRNCYNRGSFVRNMKEAFFPPASLLYEGGSLRDHGDAWFVSIEMTEEDPAPRVMANRMAATDRARRRGGTDMLTRSLSTTTDHNTGEVGSDPGDEETVRKDEQAARPIV